MGEGLRWMDLQLLQDRLMTKEEKIALHRKMSWLTNMILLSRVQMGAPPEPTNNQCSGIVEQRESGGEFLQRHQSTAS
jgi:hypothetical protein